MGEHFVDAAHCLPTRYQPWRLSRIKPDRWRRVHHSQLACYQPPALIRQMFIEKYQLGSKQVYLVGHGHATVCMKNKVAAIT